MIMKDKIVAVVSNFGLGPVGKLASIINVSKDTFEWYATGQEFDITIFNDKNVFKGICWTEDEEKMRKFVEENNIKCALVVLKNKYARFFKSIGLNVIYIDSLPFMWTQEDAKSGKIPYDVDIYCAQKSIKLDEKSKEIFKKVKNLKWINPIVPSEKLDEKIKQNNSILINVGGLHSPVGSGKEYINVVIKPLIECLLYKYNEKKIIIACGKKANANLKEMLKKYNVIIKTYKQAEFLKAVQSSYLFFSSPGLTTLLEVANFDKKTILLPPQNLSQFYNIEYAKELLHKYKVINWNREGLQLNDLKRINMVENEIVLLIYRNIKKLQSKSEVIRQKRIINNILNEDFFINKNYQKKNSSGTNEIIEYINEIIKGD